MQVLKMGLLICVFGLSSCQILRSVFQKKSFIPDNLSLYSQGEFSGVAKAYQKQKEHHFTVDIFISGQKNFRMDLSLGPGVPVATLLLSPKKADPKKSTQKEPEQLKILFFQTKKFYEGPISTFSKHKDIPSFFSKLSMSTLQEVFFDKKPKGKNWLCEMDDKKLPLTCQDKFWTIKWQRGKKRLLSFKEKDFEFVFQYSFFSNQVEKSMFHIETPKNFRKLLLIK